MPFWSASCTIRTMRPVENERPKRGKARRVSTRQHWGEGMHDGPHPSDLSKLSSLMSWPLSSRLLTNIVELSRSSLSWFNHSNCEVSVFILSYFKSDLLHNIFESLGNEQVLLTWGVSAELLLRGPRWQPLWKRRSPYNPGPTIGQSRGSAVGKAQAKIWDDKV